MHRLMFASLVVVGLLAAAAPAQNKDVPFKSELKKIGPAPGKTAADAGARAKAPSEAGVPGDVEINFLNGSVVRMIVQSEKLEIVTPYGPLAVPVKDIRSIEFGLHFPEGIAAKIDAAVKSLGGNDYREREKAGKTLVELGPFSYPAVLEASRAKDLEISRRAKEIVKQLQLNHPKKDLKTSDEDKIVTPTFTIAGRIVTPMLRAQTELFGQVELSVTKMRTLRAVAAPSANVEVTLDATKYANAGQWMETNFHVDGRAPLVITAKGVVDTWPQQPGQYLVGPNGQQGGRMILNNGNIIVGGGVIRKGVGALGQANGGALVGRIGEDGEPFQIGERYEGTPETEGKLYLHIVPSPWNCPSSGTYEVKIGR